MKPIVIMLLVAAPLAAQDRSLTSQNPLPALMAELRTVLAGERAPFTAEQERAIVLMMEDRRQASEDLFRDLMDFSAGPTSGQEAERLQSAIAWIREDFINRLPRLPDCGTTRGLESPQKCRRGARGGGHTHAVCAYQQQSVRRGNGHLSAARAQAAT